MNLKGVLLFCLCACLLILSTCKQEATSTGDNSAILLIPDDGDFRLTDLTEMPDGNILIAGFRRDDILDAFGIYYMVDPNTRKVRKLSELENRFSLEPINAMVNTNGEMVVIFRKSKFTGSGDIVRLDKNYKALDSVVIQTNVLSFLKTKRLTQVRDGNYIMMGDSAVLKKYDPHFKTIWEKKEPKGLISLRVIETNDGSFVTVGTKKNTLFYLNKYDVNGTLVFAKTESGIGNTNGYYDVIEQDGKYIACGWTGENAVISTYNEKGDRLSMKIFETQNDEFGRKLIPTADGGYVFLVHKLLQNTQGIKILKLDSEFNILWEKEVLKLGKENAAPLAITLKDGRIVIGCYGETSSNTIYGTDASLIFLDKNGNF